MWPCGTRILPFLTTSSTTALAQGLTLRTNCAHTLPAHYSLFLTQPLGFCSLTQTMYSSAYDSLSIRVKIKTIKWDFPGSSVGDPTCLGAAKSMSHNCQACALEPGSYNCQAHVPQLLKPPQPRASAPQERPPQWEACAPQWRVDPAHYKSRKAPAVMQIQQSHK